MTSPRRTRSVHTPSQALSGVALSEHFQHGLHSSTSTFFASYCTIGCCKMQTTHSPLSCTIVRRHHIHPFHPFCELLFASCQVGTGCMDLLLDEERLKDAVNTKELDAALSKVGINVGSALGAGTFTSIFMTKCIGEASYKDTYCNVTSLYSVERDICACGQ
eukprot:TRINITY_DN5599_c0_g2_i1.p1 TRINITY_DN5599_c0_g2~~TRINITY_DN5599_c0_g2_i1.p1  ORF type:complete len:162 (-),score=7.98 TRINITY_DN5599_c0_g2_i1:124-609(-)